MLSIKNKKCINPFKKLIYHTLVRLKLVELENILYDSEKRFFKVSNLKIKLFFKLVTKSIKDF